jgi:hypothetical protein
MCVTGPQTGVSADVLLRGDRNILKGFVEPVLAIAVRLLLSRGRRPCYGLLALVT